MRDKTTRRYARFLTELDLVLSDASGNALDNGAQAYDVSPAGFRAETKVKLKEKDRVLFSLLLSQGDRAQGQAEVVWISQNEWGWTMAGMKIVNISRSDARKIRNQIYQPGYDFFGLAKLAAQALYLIIIVAALENIAIHQKHLHKFFIELLPIMGAILILSFSLFALKRDNEGDGK